MKSVERNNHPDRQKIIATFFKNTWVTFFIEKYERGLEATDT